MKFTLTRVQRLGKPVSFQRRDMRYKHITRTLKIYIRDAFWEENSVANAKTIVSFVRTSPLFDGLRALSNDFFFLKLLNWLVSSESQRSFLASEYSVSKIELNRISKKIKNFVIL